MLLLCGLLLLLSSTRTTGISENRPVLDEGFDRSISFSHWPSLHNGASMWRIRKRELQDQVGLSEGGDVKSQAVHNQSISALPPAPLSQPAAAPSNPPVPVPEKPGLSNGNTLKVETTTNNTGTVQPSPVPHANVTVVKNETAVEEADKLDLSSPGVVKRGIIVFGGFALLAVAYFIFYRRKSGKNDAGNNHNANDANQFRYGVLQSDDRRDNLELSRIPLTMESDDDEDDDLEIFDLEQKRKSLSYVNLQVNDEEIVNGRKDSLDNDRDNLLLDIEDANSDTLINWSSNGNKSIL